MLEDIRLAAYEKYKTLKMANLDQILSELDLDHINYFRRDNTVARKWKMYHKKLKIHLIVWVYQKLNVTLAGSSTNMNQKLLYHNMKEDLPRKASYL